MNTTTNWVTTAKTAFTFTAPTILVVILTIVGYMR